MRLSHVTYGRTNEADEQVACQVELGEGDFPDEALRAAKDWVNIQLGITPDPGRAIQDLNGVVCALESAEQAVKGKVSEHARTAERLMSLLPARSGELAGSAAEEVAVEAAPAEESAI